MADFFRGLAGGFQTGLQFGNAMQQREERERLREAAGLTPQEMQQRQASPEDARMFGLGPQEQAAYAPQMPAEGQRVGLPRYQLAGQTYDRAPTQQEIQQARYGAMADVIAERDPARAMEMRQRLEEQAYQAQRRPLELQSLQGQIAGQGLTQQAQRLTISEAERKVKQDEANRNAQTLLADIRTTGGPVNTQVLSKIAKDTGADYNTLLTSELNQLGYTEKTAAAEMKTLSRDWSKAVLGGDKSINKFLSEKFDPDKTDNTVPELVKTKTGYVVMYGNRVLNEFGSHKDLTSFGATVNGIINDDMLGTIKTLAAVRASDASADASRATTAYRGLQGQVLATQAAGNAEAQQIRARYDALTPDEQAGPIGQGLIRNFNMANAKAGASVPLGSPPRAERPEVPASAVVDYAKGLIGKPSGEMKDGKPVKYTAETAAAAARRALSAQGGAAADPADALIEAMRKNAPAQRQATPAGQSLVNLSNIMLPPAAPVVTAPTTSQERLRGLYLQPVKPQ
jgi:hypothetical protein